MHEKITQENAVTGSTKEREAKHKALEAKVQDETSAEYSVDREAANAELQCWISWKIKDRRIAVPDTYASRSTPRPSQAMGSL